MAKVKTHTFFGRRYNIDREKFDGLCEHPENNSQSHRLIYVSPDLEPDAELETFVHESLHACFPRMTEKNVTQAGADIARLLWRLGYRKGK